jgi:uncharacterized protein
VGFSQGGLIAQLVAGQDKRIAALATWSSVAGDGVGEFHEFMDQYYAAAQRNGFAVVSFPWRSSLNFGKQWFDEIKTNRSLTELKNYQGTLLAIAGSDDTQVSNESSRKLIQAAGSTDATLMIIKGADHIYNVLGPAGLASDQTHAENLLNSTANWFARKL